MTHFIWSHSRLICSPDGGGRRRPVDLGGEDELAALLDLGHLGEVSLDGGLDGHEAEEGLALRLARHVLRRQDDLGTVIT